MSQRDRALYLISEFGLAADCPESIIVEWNEYYAQLFETEV